MSSNRLVFTIGHSTQPVERFLELLAKHGVTAVADVRSSPYSKHAPQFSTDELRASLNEAGVAYVFLGKELGARSNDDSCYVNDVVSYERLARSQLFQRGIQRVEDGCERHRIALMCSERDPTECHRTILVSKVLCERGAEIKHILSNGMTESHEETMLRVLDILGMPREDMLNSQDELVSKAYFGREKQIAYRRGG
ncbi:DUF488 family protein [Thioclava sp. 15-R06ZXC-3]|uniref:DUF488 family protein n=1 Tax=Thioclava arctica TaxID=3238301 RepID=A0ABV3TIK0_9RHOB